MKLEPVRITGELKLLILGHNPGCNIFLRSQPISPIGWVSETPHWRPLWQRHSHYFLY